MADPKAKFTVTYITREGIAEDLNDYYQAHTETEETPIASDDDRLTDEICQEVADKLNEIDVNCADAGRYREDRMNEAEQELWWSLLARFGLVENNQGD